MRKLISSICLVLFFIPIYAQVGINKDGSSPDNSAGLDVKFTDRGFLSPRLTNTQRNSIVNPATGLFIFNTDLGSHEFYSGSSTGWLPVLGSLTGWTTKGNEGTMDGTHFIGTTDNVSFNIKVNSQKAGRIDPAGLNAFFGYQAGNNVTTGTNNTAFGSQSMYNNVAGSNATAIGKAAMAYFNNTATPFPSYSVAVGFEALRGSTSPSSNTGNFNTATGYQSLWSNSSGQGNLASGYAALRANSTGSYNTAEGYMTSYFNTTGSGNTALGSQALLSSVAGSNATAIGTNAMQYAYNTSTPYTNSSVAVGFEALKGSANPAANTGNENVAIGYQALTGNTFGRYNFAGGNQSLFSNSGGYYNTAVGYQSAYQNNSSYNTAFGYKALYSNIAGSNGTAIGAGAMENCNSTTSVYSNWNVAVGFEALKGSLNPADNTGNFNTAVGSQGLNRNSSGSNNVSLGYRAMFYNETGNENIAIGGEAVYQNFSGSSNVGIGYYALHWPSAGNGNTAVGDGAGGLNNTVSYCTFVGMNAWQSAAGLSNGTAIGYGSSLTASNQVRIGNASVTSIGGFVNWTNISDGRFKKNVSENVEGLDFIMKLRPVTYNLDIEEINSAIRPDGQLHEGDSRHLKSADQDLRALKEKEAILYSGFVAQDVEKAARESGYSFSGVDAPKNENDPYGLRYADFVVPLVKAMQEQQAVIEDLKAQNAGLIKRIEALEKR